jgi:putative flavoprotein involved in K+ transport
MDIASPHGRVSTWLAQFSDALEKGDVEAAKALFGDTCYWRDLVAFTWNIKTMEGRDAIGDMLTAQLGHVHPKDWTIEGDVTDADGTAEAWLRFETDAVHGLGHLRLAGDKALTLLTTAQELKGHEDPKGPNRPKGVEHGAFHERKTYAERRADEAAHLGYDEQPYVVIIGGGQGGIALGARLRRLGVPHHRHREEPPPRRQLAQPLQVALPARPGLVRPPPLSELPRSLAGLRAEGQDRRLA